MLSEERKRRICAILETDGSVTIRKLSELFAVSGETIRRDLADLEQNGYLHRSHGGAVSTLRMMKPKDLTDRMEENILQKRELSETAMQFIREGDVIAVDSGTTAVEFVRVLCEHYIHLTVVSHSLDVANLLKKIPPMQVILCGGYYDHAENAFWGDMTLDALSHLHVKKCFLFPSAVSVSHGLMDYEYRLLQIQKAYLKISDEHYFLADSSKLEHTALLKLGDFTPNSTIITDSSISAEVCQLYRSSDIRIVF